MVAALSMALQTRVACALEQGETVRAVAKRSGVSVASAVRIGQRQRAGCGQVPGKVGGGRRAVLAGESGEWLLMRLAEKPDLTMRALTAELAARGMPVAHDTVWRFVRKAGQTVKKNELSLKVGDRGIGWHIKALLTRRSARREKDMPHDEGYGGRVSRARRIFARPADGFAAPGREGFDRTGG